MPKQPPHDPIHAETAELLREARRRYQQFEHTPSKSRRVLRSTPDLLYDLIVHVEKLYELYCQQLKRK